jgi:hypothetical protein
MTNPYTKIADQAQYAIDRDGGHLDTQHRANNVAVQQVAATVAVAGELHDIAEMLGVLVTAIDSAVEGDREPGKGAVLVDRLK